MPKELVKDLENIFILGRGDSLLRCPVKKPEKTEYWGCNSVYKAREVDRLFIMHDLYVTQFNRDNDLIKNINEKNFPVYTLGGYEKIKNNVLYPMEEVIEEFKIAYFLTNIAYMLALAILQKPKHILLFGVDLDWGTQVEYLREEKANVEYWIGVVTGKGIEMQITQESTLLKRKGRGNFYGMIVRKDDSKSANHSVVLEPQYEWGKEKSAMRYKIMKIENTI